MSEEAFLDWKNYESYEEFVFSMTGKHGSYVCPYCRTPYKYSFIKKLNGGECCKKCGAKFTGFEWEYVE